MLSSARRPGPTVRTRVREVRDDGAAVTDQQHEDRLATEEPLEVRLAWPGAETRRVWVTMRTPGHDYELATGFLRHEGVLVAAPRSVAYCTDADLTPDQELNVVTVRLAEPPASLPADRSGALSAGSSACGVCGVDSIDAALRVAARRTPASAPPFDLALVRSLPDRLREAQRVFARTGGVHAAGLFTVGGDPVVVREDIGRHNAVDKVTGARVLAGADPAAPYLVVSGRIGFELVQKALAAGVGALVAVGAPSSLAVDLARRGGLGLVGFTRPQRCVVYAEPR